MEREGEEEEGQQGQRHGAQHCLRDLYAWLPPPHTVAASSRRCMHDEGTQEIADEGQGRKSEVETSVAATDSATPCSQLRGHVARALQLLGDRRGPRPLCRRAG